MENTYTQDACEQLKLELAVKQAQLQETKMKARVAAAKAAAAFAEEIGQQEREIQAVKKRLMAASYDTGSSGSEVWLEIKEGLSRAAKAVIRMVRQFLDRL